MKSTTLPPAGGLHRAFQQYYALTKPRVVQLIVFCAVIGMFLATPGLPPWRPLVFGTAGIWLVASAAAAFNCLVEQRIDAVMRRTAWRPSATGELRAAPIIAFSGTLCALGMLLLDTQVNALTMWLTFGTFIGYAVIYTVLLKPATPQNIVIGGASGAMPPVLGWVAVSGHVGAQALILFLIIFLWTPPHFWALALYRADDYRKSGLPMLPVTHGSEYTRLQALLYTVLLTAVSMMPYAIHMSGLVYAISAVLLDAVFLAYAWELKQRYSDALARRMFRYSIVYLSLLFGAMLVDHYLRF